MLKKIKTNAHTKYPVSRLCVHAPGCLAVALQPNAIGFAHYSSTRVSVPPLHAGGKALAIRVKLCRSNQPTSRGKGKIVCPVVLG